MPVASAPPPPTAAPPKTAAPPSAKPAPPPPVSAPAKPKELEDPFKDAFAGIDELDTEKKPEKAPAKEAPKVPESDEEPPATQDGEKTAQEKEQKPFKAKELRDAYEGLKKKVKEEYEPQVKELASLRAKVKEFESRDETQTKETKERIAAIEKRNSELESHMRFVDYEKSKEYQEQFYKPYADAWSAALSELKGLTMTFDDPKTGEPVTREVSQADIAYFANLDPAARRTEINRLFPEDKEEVKRHINQISTLAQKAQEAREKARTDAETHAKTRNEAQQQAQKDRQKFWKESNESIAAKYPQWFARSEEDQEGNALFDRGTALADLAFNPTDLTEARIALLPKAFRGQIESGKPFSQAQLVQLHTIVRNKAANHDRLAHQNKALSARVAELEKNLKEFENSEPDKIPAASHKPPNGPLKAEDELDALDRKFI